MLGKGDNDSSLHGPQRTITYLQTELPTGESELLFKFARWPLEQDPEAPISIFTNASRLHPDEVLKFVGSLPSNGAEMLYLEYITFSGDHVSTSKYIERLIDLYISNGEHRRLAIYAAAVQRHATTDMHTSSLVLNLALAQKRAAEQRMVIGSHHFSWTTRTHGKARQAQLTAQNRCKVCQKRFSNTGAVRVLPRSDVVHWGCVKEENE